MKNTDADEHIGYKNNANNSGLFDLALSEYVKEEAIARVEAHNHAEWKEAALIAILEAASMWPTFTTDEVWPLIGHDPMLQEPRALGAVMRNAEKAGYIQATKEFILSKSVSRHRAPKRVWQSLVHHET